jgi:hypothetical protein
MKNLQVTNKNLELLAPPMSDHPLPHTRRTVLCPRYKLLLGVSAVLEPPLVELYLVVPVHLPDLSQNGISSPLVIGEVVPPLPKIIRNQL